MHTVVDATRDLLVNVLQYHPFLIKPNNHELGEPLPLENSVTNGAGQKSRAPQFP